MSSSGKRDRIRIRPDPHQDARAPWPISVRSHGPSPRQIGAFRLFMSTTTRFSPVSKIRTTTATCNDERELRHHYSRGRQRDLHLVPREFREDRGHLPARSHTPPGGIGMIASARRLDVAVAMAADRSSRVSRVVNVRFRRLLPGRARRTFICRCFQYLRHAATSAR